MMPDWLVDMTILGLRAWDIHAFEWVIWQAVFGFLALAICGAVYDITQSGDLDNGYQPRTPRDLGTPPRGRGPTRVRE